MAVSKVAKSTTDNRPLYISLLSLAVCVIGIPLMLLAWIEPHLENDQKNQISLEVGNQLKGPLATINETNTSLEDLKPFIRDVINHQFENASKLSPQALEEHLPAIKNLLTVAQDQGVRVEPQVSEALRKNLLHVPNNALGYWPAAAQLISYRNAGFTIPQNATIPCNQTAGSVVVTGGPAPADMLGEASYSNCTLDLDQPNLWSASKSSPHIESQGEIVSSWHLTLHNVIVHYRGGPLAHVSEITFDHCILDFQFNVPPSAPAQRLTETLLTANDINNVSFKIPAAHS